MDDLLFLMECFKNGDIGKDEYLVLIEETAPKKDLHEEPRKFLKRKIYERYITEILK